MQKTQSGKLDAAEILAFYDSLGDVRGRVIKTANHFGINRATVYGFLNRQEVTKPPHLPISVDSLIPSRLHQPPKSPGYAHSCGIDCAWGCPLDEKKLKILPGTSGIEELLFKKPHTINELVEALDLRPSEVRVLLVELPDIHSEDGRFWLSKPAPVVAELAADRQARRDREEAKAHKARYEQSLKQQEELERQLDVALRIAEPVEPLAITANLSHNGGEATALMLASDWHVEENVDPSTVNGLNKYNPEIAERRAKNYFANGLKLVRKERQDVTIDNLVLWLGGDLISGYIHDELEESNHLSPTEATLFAKRLIMGGLKMLKEDGEFKQITVITSFGNHGRCVDGATEILTDKGFVPAPQITKESIVATFEPSTRAVIYAPVIDTMSFLAPEKYTIESHFSDECVSDGHKVYYKGTLTPVNDLIGVHKQSDFAYAGKMENQEEYSAEELNRIRLITQIVMDGTVVDRRVKEKTNAVRIQFKVSLPRKIDRLQSLLNEMRIPFTIRSGAKTGGNILQPQVICIYGDIAKTIWDEWLGGRKILPDCFRALTGRAVRAIVDEIGQTDGTLRGDNIEWTSTERENVEIVQHACVTNNIPVKIKDREPLGMGQKHQFAVAIYPDGLTERSRAHSVQIAQHSEPTAFYGITAERGTLITRRNGKVSLTGNTTQKRRVSTSYKNSFEWMLYQDLADRYQGDEIIQVQTGNGYLQYLKVYDQNLRFHHGDNIHYQGGVGGVSIPLNKFVARTNQQQWATCDSIGHYHQYTPYSRISRTQINGSLIGFNAYAQAIGCSPEPPLQLFQIIDSKRGFTISAPIFCEDV